MRTLVMMMLLLGCSGLAQAALPVRALYQTTVTALDRAYHRNEVATQDAISGRDVQLTGIIQSINEEFGSVEIDLRTHQFLPAGMMMRAGSKKIAATLSRGQQVTIRCRHVERLLGSPAGRQCVFVHPLLTHATHPQHPF